MSGYHLHQGISLKSFPEINPELFLQEDPLSEPVCIVVQNAGLGEWLTRSLARRQGGVMGLQIMMPEQALRRFAGGYSTARQMVSPDGSDPGADNSTLSRGEGCGLLFMDGLKLAVYKAVEESVSGEDPLFTPLRDYAGSGGSRLWQLADSLAGIFYHYGMNCLPLVEAWDSGSAYPGLPPEQKKAEDWQRALWNRIFHSGSPYTHLSRVLSETMAAGDGYDGPSSRIVLFGSMFLGETGLRFFRHLADSLDIHHFLFTPSRVFTAGSAQTGTAVTTMPFLRDNGRLSADFASLLPVLDPDFSDWQGIETPGGSTLENLRCAITENRPFNNEVSDDGSLTIHDSPGLRRQVEVLKDRILESLRDDETLAPTDIGILAPDIASFAPYIEAIFPGGDEGRRDNIPFNLSDLPTRSEAPFPAAFSKLMELPGSRFGRNSLTGLFENPCFSPSSSNPDLADSWRRMAEELRVRWGTDSNHRQAEQAADPTTGSWDFAFSRLLAAYYHDEGDNPDLLPGPLEGDSDADVAGRLMRTIRALDGDLRNLDTCRFTLKEWTLKWERIIDTWLKPRTDDDSGEDESDRLRIKGAIRDLMALDEDLDGLRDFSNRAIPWSAFSSLLSEMTAPSGGRKGRYLARGVTCASLKPMRAIPFRRIYVLGLDEGAWPGHEYLTGFDLRESIDKPIDLSRESVDRFAFLETLFAATDHLSFFFSGRDAERGDPLSPASPIAELCDFLGTGWKNLLRTHPLAPYNHRVLGGDPLLASSSSRALALAESLRRGPSPGLEADEFLTPPATEDVLDWKDLAGFLKNPIRYFFKDVLRASAEISRPDEGEEDVLEPEFLDWWNWRSDTVLSAPASLTDPGLLVDSFSTRLALEGAVAETPVGRLSEFRRRTEAQTLADQYIRVRNEGLDDTEAFSILLDPVVTSVSGRAEPGETVRLPAPRLVNRDGSTLAICGRIHGFRLLNREGRRDPGIWTLPEFVSGNQVKSRHLLSSWTVALILGALQGDVLPGELRIFRLGGHDFPARRYYLQPGIVPDSGGGERRILERPDETLNQLIRIREDSGTVPLALHPEIADALSRTESREGELAGEALTAAADKAWRSIVSNPRGSSGLRDCPWRHRFLDRPDFTSPVFRNAWSRLYREGGLL